MRNLLAIAKRSCVAYRIHNVKPLQKSHLIIIFLLQFFPPFKRHKLVHTCKDKEFYSISYTIKMFDGQFFFMFPVIEKKKSERDAKKNQQNEKNVHIFIYNDRGHNLICKHIMESINSLKHTHKYTYSFAFFI